MEKRRLLIALAMPLVFVGLIGLDRFQTRADRKWHARRVDMFLQVRDQVLRYEYEQGTLPAALQDLVPSYLVADQIAYKSTPRYHYDPQGRTLAMVRGTSVRGLFTREYAPAILDLPPLSKSDRVAALPPRKLADLLLPTAPEAKPLPPRSFLFEAEAYSEMNYGWEVTPDGQAGGGAYIHVKEGMANSSGQRHRRLGDFYNINNVRDVTYLKVHFRIPEAGRYLVYGRIWTTGSHCSNNISVGLDTHGVPRGSLDNRTPFRWVWTPVGGLFPCQLSAGDHFLHFFPHEDGVRIDQILITPTRVQGDVIFKSNLETGIGTRFLEKLTQPLHLTFDVKSMIMTPELPPQVRLVLRRVKDCTGMGEVRVKLEGAGPDQGDLLLACSLIDLGQLPPLAFLSIDFKDLNLQALKRREYLLKATLTQAGKVLASGHVPLMKPFAWQMLGMFPYLANGQKGPADGLQEPDGAQKLKWQDFNPKHFDHFGVLDFGLHTIGNSLQAPYQKTIYAQTVISVPERMPALLKLQSDDQMMLWIDGRLACRMDSAQPVTRAGKWFRLVFTPGTHRIRMRVNQGTRDKWGHGRWQATLRIRTPEDRIAPVVGVEPPFSVPAKR